MTGPPAGDGRAPPPANDPYPLSTDVRRADWIRVWQQLGVANAPVETYEELIRHYSEPNRAYHTLQHLEECLQVRRQICAPCSSPAEVDLALWFHDAIYQPVRFNNEERSAQWLDEVARSSALGEEIRRRLRGLVMVTRHDGAPATPDEAVLVDTDLSILGAAPERFDEYDLQIRREYRHVPALLYRRKRRLVLLEFSSRARIYTTEPYFNAFETQARANLARAIERLS